MTRLTNGILAGAVFAVMLVAPGAAQAACSSSTPASVHYVDSLFDGDSQLAPELGTVVASLDGACSYRVDAGLLAPLAPDASVFVWLDVDGNAATGDPTFGGADKAVGTSGVAGPGGLPTLGRWDPRSARFVFDGPTLAPFGAGGFSASLDSLGVTPGAATGVQVVSILRDGPTNYVDFAPNPVEGSLRLLAAFPQAPPPSAPGAGGTTMEKCRVPTVRGKRLDGAEEKLADAGCPVVKLRRAYDRRVKRGRVIQTTPRAGKVAKRGVRIVVSRGRKRSRGARSAVVAQRTVLEHLADVASATGR